MLTCMVQGSRSIPWIKFRLANENKKNAVGSTTVGGACVLRTAHSMFKSHKVIKFLTTQLNSFRKWQTGPKAHFSQRCIPTSYKQHKEKKKLNCRPYKIEITLQKFIAICHVPLCHRNREHPCEHPVWHARMPRAQQQQQQKCFNLINH